MSSRSTLFVLAWAVACAACLSFCAGGAPNGEVPPAPAASEAGATGEAAGEPGADVAASDTPAAGAVPETPSRAAGSNAAAVPASAGEDLYDPATAVGAVKGVPAATNTAPIEAVANFFTDLPGFDLTALDAPKREKFLHRVNSEMCSCGCKNDTLAHCLVNDPRCPTVKGLVQAVYDEVKAGR